MKIVDIKTNQETTIEQFTALQQYKNNLKCFLDYVKENKVHRGRKIKGLEQEYLQIKKTVKEIFEGKKNYSSIEYNSKINKQ